MEPLLLDPGQWDRLAGLLVDLTAAVGLALTAAFAFLLGHVVLPAFADARTDLDRTDERQPAEPRRHANAPALRWILDQMAGAAVVAMLVGLGRAVVNAADVLHSMHPHVLI
jgi:hypothetical protein